MMIFISLNNLLSNMGNVILVRLSYLLFLCMQIYQNISVKIALKNLLKCNTFMSNDRSIIIYATLLCGSWLSWLIIYKFTMNTTTWHDLKLQIQVVMFENIYISNTSNGFSYWTGNFKCLNLSQEKNVKTFLQFYYTYSVYWLASDLLSVCSYSCNEAKNALRLIRWRSIHFSTRQIIDKIAAWELSVAFSTQKIHQYWHYIVCSDLKRLCPSYLSLVYIIHTMVSLWYLFCFVKNYFYSVKLSKKEIYFTITLYKWL